MLKYAWEIERLLTDITSDILNEIADIIAIEETCTFFSSAQLHSPATYRYYKERGSQAVIRALHNLEGYCAKVPELAEQCVSGERYIRFATFYSGDHYDDPFRHKSIIVFLDSDLESAPVPYLIDPTFKQFGNPGEYWQDDFWESPDYRLNILNPSMRDHLVTKGFYRLTSENAEHYLQCFARKDTDFSPFPNAMETIVPEYELTPY